MHGDFDDMQDTEIRVTQLQTNLQLLKQRVDERKKLLLETLAFYKNNKQVSQLVKSFLVLWLVNFFRHELTLQTKVKSQKVSIFYQLC